MKLWVISSSYPANPEESINAGVLARDVACTLSAAGHEVTVVTPAKPRPMRMDPGLRSIVLPTLVPVDELASLSPRKPHHLVALLSLMVGGYAALRRAVRHRRPDATIALWALPSGVFARWVRRWSGVPYAVWLLGSDVWKSASYPRGRWILRRVLLEAAGRFADGMALASEAKRLTGIDVEFLPSVRRLPTDGAANSEPCDVLFVGRYHPNKGPDVLLEAFARVAAELPGARLRMHGIGEMRAELEARRRRLGLEAAVRIEGPIDARGLAAALRSARLLVIPSRIESIPLILGDAAQMGRPVVATNVGDLGAVIDRHGLGRVVPPEDPTRLAAAIVESLRSGPSELSPETRTTFRPDHIVKTLLRAFDGGAQ